MKSIIFKSCYKCTKRVVGCHATCNNYAIEKATHDELKRQDNLNKDAIVYEYEAAIKRNNKMVMAKKKHVTVRRNYR